MSDVLFILVYLSSKCSLLFTILIVGIYLVIKGIPTKLCFIFLN